MVKNFNDLEAWQKGHQLVLELYQVAKKFPKEELYGLTSQLRRSAVSITANIAEGFARFHFKDKIKFYYQARGSAGEVQNYLFLCRDMELIDKEKFEILFPKTMAVQRLINGLIRSIENQREKSNPSS